MPSARTKYTAPDIKQAIAEKYNFNTRNYPRISNLKRSKVLDKSKPKCLKSVFIMTVRS